VDPQIQELIERMRELVDIIRSTSKIGLDKDDKDDKVETGGDAAKAFTRGSDKIVNAMATLAVKLEGKAKTAAAEERAVNKFAEQVEKVTATQDSAAKIIAEAAAAAAKALAEANEAARLAARTDQQIAADKRSANIKKLGEDAQAAKKSLTRTEQVWKDFEDLGSGSQLLKDKFMSLGGNSMTARIGLQALAAGAEGVVKSLAGFGSALDKGQRGAAVGAQALSDLATPLLDFADTIGKIITFGSFLVPGGAIIKGLRIAGGALLSLGSSAGKLSLEYIKVSAAAADALFKSFNSLSEAGATTAGGMDDVFAQLQTLGMTLSEIDKFTTLIGKNGKVLSQFGATAAEGAKMFSEVAGTLVKSDLGQQLAQLGITADEQRESALAYMNIQAKTGQLNLKNTKQLIEESGKFAKELDLSARLTGATRKEALEAKEFAQSEERFRAAQIEAEQTGDTERQADLKLAEEMSVIAKLSGDTVGQLGILQNAAARGAPSTTEGIAAGQTYDVQGITQAGREARARGENLSQAQIMDMMAQSAKKTQSLAGSNAISGAISPLQTGVVAPANFINRNDALTKGATEAGFTGPNARDDFLKTEEGKRIAEANKPGSTTGAMVGADRAQQSAAMMMDSAKAVGMAASVNQRASTAFADAVKVFSKTVGAKQPTGGTYSNAELGTTGTLGTPGTPGTPGTLTTPATLGTAPTPNAPQGRTETGTPISPIAAIQTSAIAESRAAADAAREKAIDAVKKHEEAKAELDIFKKANASREQIAAVEARIAMLAKEREKAEQDEGAASRKVSTQATALKAQQTKDAQEYNKWLNGNVNESKKIGTTLITDEATRQIYAFDEAKLAETDRDNYERFVKRKEQLIKDGIENFEKINKIKAGEISDAEKEKIKANARAQAAKEFTPAAVETGAATVMKTTLPAIPTTPTTPAAAVSAPTAAGAPQTTVKPAAPVASAPQTTVKPAAPVASAPPPVASAPPPVAPVPPPPVPPPPVPPPPVPPPPVPPPPVPPPTEQTAPRSKNKVAKTPKQTEISGQLKEDLISQLSASGITSKTAQANIFGNLEAESKGDVSARESLNYSPERLLKVFPKYFKDLDDAKAVVAQGEEAIGNRVYGNRNGNAANEGYMYRGRGLVQLTGKYNYEKFSKLLNIPDLVTNPDLAADPEISKKIAVAFFKEVQKGGKGGTDLTDISAMGKGVGYVGGQEETNKRAALATKYMAAGGGVVKSTPGGVGIVAGEAGKNEAFVPLPDGKSIPVKQDTTVVKDVQNLSAQVSGLSKLIAGKMITQTGATDDDLGMDIKSSDVLAKLIRTIIPGLGMIEKIGGIGNTVAGVTDTDSKMTGSDKVMEVVKLLVPQVRILAGIYDTISPFLKSDDNTATLAKRPMPVAPVATSLTVDDNQQPTLSTALAAPIAPIAPTALAAPTAPTMSQVADALLASISNINKEISSNTLANPTATPKDSDSTKATTALAASISDLGKITGNNPLATPNATAAPDWAKMESKLSATMSDFGNLAGTNTPNLGEITSPSIDRADVTSNNIGKLIDELKEQNRSNMKDAMSSVAGELKDAFKGMSPQSSDNSSSQELVAAVNEMVRTQRDTNTISSRILQVSQN